MSTTCEQLITATGLADVAITTTEQAREQRDALLARSAKGTVVNSAETAESAGWLLRDIKAFTKLVEDTRKIVKQPFLERSRQIDTLATELTARLDAEASRISRLLGGYQAEENRKAEEARRLAWEEEQRIKREAARKEREAQEAEEARQAELLRKQQVARTAENAAKYAAEAEARALKARQEEERRALEAEQAIIATRVAASAVAAPKQQGIATRQVRKFEVVDIVALYEAAPYLVTLAPNVAAINNALKTLTKDQTLPGIRWWSENVSVVR
jgi:hypothetical protein